MDVQDMMTKDQHLGFLLQFVRNKDWDAAARCAEYVLQRFGEDFEVACVLQQAAIVLSVNATQTVAAQTATLQLAVVGSMHAAIRVDRANTLVRRLGPSQIPSTPPVE